eukprot:scpid106740/ scgid27286/ 
MSVSGHKNVQSLQSYDRTTAVDAVVMSHAIDDPTVATASVPAACTAVAINPDSSADPSRSAAASSAVSPSHVSPPSCSAESPMPPVPSQTDAPALMPNNAMVLVPPAGKRSCIPG